jgi:hypothetical protein
MQLCNVGHEWMLSIDVMESLDFVLIVPSEFLPRFDGVVPSLSTVLLDLRAFTRLYILLEYDNRRGIDLNWMLKQCIVGVYGV